MWIFEPHVAEQVFEDFVSEYQLRVDRNEWLDRSKGVVKTGGRIMSIAMVSGEWLHAAGCSSTPPMKAI